ncbi:MAG TPA: hypothetical protein PL161_12720 [Spirochaetota bacterium]|nr:hypothetical protein [Spirochaetota bacterium]
MKRAVIIISHNQAASIHDMRKALKSVKADRLWVLDRCSDDSAQLLSGETVVTNKEGRGFLAGKMRDIGLDEVLKGDYDEVVFLDGDRIPQNISDNIINEEMQNSDCIIFHRDLPEIDEQYFKLLNVPRIVTQVYSVGLCVKTKFLKMIRSKCPSKRCFNPVFDGEWGFEDYFFGLELFLLGARIEKSSIRISGSYEPEEEKLKRLTINYNKFRYMRDRLYENYSR